MRPRGWTSTMRCFLPDILGAAGLVVAFMAFLGADSARYASRMRRIHDVIPKVSLATEPSRHFTMVKAVRAMLPPPRSICSCALPDAVPTAITNSIRSSCRSHCSIGLRIEIAAAMRRRSVTLDAIRLICRLMAAIWRCAPPSTFMAAFDRRCAQVLIDLHKEIPAGAGLGGGSSDAGAVLRMMASMCRISDDRRACRLALKIGADVPFFLDPRPARVGGIGERIAP